MSSVDPGHRRFKVLQLIGGFTIGGAEKLVVVLSTELDRGRFEVLPCALRRTGPFEEDLKAAGVNYRILNLRRWSVLTGPLFLLDMKREVAALADLMRELRVDIVHTHLSESSLLGIPAARQAGVPLVFTSVHNVNIHPHRNWFSPRRLLKAHAIDRVFSQADRVIAVSEEVAESLRLATTIPQEKLVTIPNGIDARPFDECPDRKTLRSELGLPQGEVIALTIGRLTEQKGYIHLLGALARLPKRECPLTLLVGDGPLRSSLEQQSRELGLANRVRFLGHRRDIPALLKASDMFVLSSLWEGLPLVLLEAMAARLPAVVTAVGGNVKVVIEGETGFLVAPADEEALATQMRKLMEHFELRTRLGENARQLFDRQFSLDRFIRAHERLYADTWEEMRLRQTRVAVHQ